tara:strand:+ start:332 stop:931 length:600 start_codon:yes stop_codon:yes gene_type:complete
MKLNKAAMFGLDARIALAIFGALSVISGAALYSAIQQSKVTAEITKLNEVEKALTAYYLDTGTLPVNSAGSSIAGGYLIENTNSAENWNGPYISYTRNNDTFLQDNDIQVAILFAKNTAWGVYNTDAIPRVACTTMNAGETCSLWAMRQWVPISLAEALDIEIDGSASISSGDVILWCKTTTNPDKCTIYYKIDIPAPL